MVQIVNIDEFFDLYDVFANELVGDTNLFVILGNIVISFLAVKFKMPYPIIILINLLWLSTIFAHTNQLVLWVIVGLVVGILFYYAFSRFWKR